MSNKLILLAYPHISLREPCRKVTDDEMLSDSFKDNISRMFSIMYYRNGVGLAAPQVGWNANVFVSNPAGRSNHDRYARVFINPSVVEIGDRIIEEEGCLSFPGIYADVERSSRVSVRYSPLGDVTRVEEELDNFPARIVQHEYDHLSGILFIDRLSIEQKMLIEPKLVSHKERIERTRKDRIKRQKEAAARKAKKAEKRRKAREKRKRKK